MLHDAVEKREANVKVVMPKPRCNNRSREDEGGRGRAQGTQYLCLRPRVTSGGVHRRRRFAKILWTACEVLDGRGSDV
jgi:hypothetical protein